MIKPTYNRVGTRDLTGGISDALTNTYNMLNANDQQRTAEARQQAVDAQNKQMFDLKLAEIDRANKDREAQIQFGKGMLQPGVMDNLLTDAISPELIKSMSFTDDEDKEYIAAKGDISKLKGSTRAKAELQNKLGDFVYTLPNTPEYQETGYEQAKRIADRMELTPAVLEELKKYQVADITAQKEAKKEGAAYAAEAKELETQIAKLRTKQGSIYDNAAGVGTEWGTNVSGDKTNKVNSANILKYADMVKNTDSAEELQGMIQEVFMNPGIPNNQKEAIAANIVISSGAKLPQGIFDFRNLNVSVEDAQKATTQYLENLKSGAYGSGGSGERGSVNPMEAQGINNEIALLEARRAGALAKANAYSVDRSTAAKNSVKARINELFGKKPTASSGGKSEQPAVKANNTGKTDTNTEKPEKVNLKDPDVKALFENVKTAKEKEKAYKDINKLAELYTSLGGTGGSAGPVDDLRIKTEAEALSKELKIPADEIVETMKSQARQNRLTENRNALISKRMFETNMTKLRKDPKVQAAYDKAWEEEARRRGWKEEAIKRAKIGNNAKPLDLDKFIERNYSDKLQYK